MISNYASSALGRKTTKFQFQSIKVADRIFVVCSAEEKERHRGLPRKIKGFGKDHWHFAGRINQPSLYDVCRQRAQYREPYRYFRKIAGLCVFRDFLLVQLTTSMKRRNGFSCTEIVL